MQRRHNSRAKMVQSLQALVCQDEAGAMEQIASLRTREIEGFEEFGEVVIGTKREIVQVERGRIRGEITHASIGNLPIDMASFNLGIRSKGGSHSNRIGIGMLAA